MRIRGQLGPWPVDLTLELESGELQQLATLLRGGEVAALPTEVAPAAPVAASGGGQGERLWQLAQECLRRAGQQEGPLLLADLAALAGSELEGKRLLVRLRHHPQVVLDTAGSTTLYCWQDL